MDKIERITPVGMMGVMGWRWGGDGRVGMGWAWGVGYRFAKWGALFNVNPYVVTTYDYRNKLQDNSRITNDGH